MKLEINVMSREFVTPSSPTPLHLINYKLSFLDQIAVPVLTHRVYFYPSLPTTNDNPISNPERSNHLKNSLSKALTLFYPLAGRLVGNNHVNCNDEGVTYIEAQAKNRDLFDVMTDQDMEEVNKLVACDLDDARDLCLVVQVTFFGCGGLAIGLGVSHKLVDGFSKSMFVKCWAAFSRGDDDRIRSPIEALSAFIWTRFMVATGANNGDRSKVYALRFTVDIRTRIVPPLSQNHFGNYIFRTFAVPSSVPAAENINQDTRYDLVKKIRDATRKVNNDYIAKLLERDDSMHSIMIDGRREDKVDIFKFSSLSRVPMYESDFGWGKPMWVAMGKVPSSKAVFFMDSKSGGGIDAWINLDIEDMVKFEADEEVKQYLSPPGLEPVISRL